MTSKSKKRYRMVSSFRRQHLIARIMSIVLLIVQGAFLDFYMMAENSPGFLAFMTTDFIVLGIWTGIMYLSYRKTHGDNASRHEYDDMKWVFIAWIAYSLHIIPQIATIFKVLPSSKLSDEDEDIFGPTMLKCILCITPMLFLCVMYSHHDAKPHSRRKYYLQKLVASVALDLFDGVEMMEYLFEQESINTQYVDSIIAFTCINVFLPTFALYELRYNKFSESGEVPSLSFKLFYIVSLVLLVDVPYFIIRVCLWRQFGIHSSVLIAKNVLAIVLAILEVIEFFGENAPKKCHFCSRLFVKEHLEHHASICEMAAEKQVELKSVEAVTVC